MASPASAQTVEHTENKADLALKSDLRVDPSTLGMGISIPLASYPGRAGAGLPVAVTYSSKVLRLDYRDTDSSRISGMKTWTQVEFAEHTTAGWTSTLAPPRVEFTGMGQYYDYHGRGACDTCVPEDFGGDPNLVGNHYVKRINVHMPDGSTHELRADDQVRIMPLEPFTGTFLAVDGTRMRFESNAGTESVLYLPDGSRYLFPAYSGGADLTATQLIDRHGNALTYNAATRKWTDTLGRDINDPLPQNPVAGTETYFYAKLVGGGDAPPYIFRWKYLGDVLTPEIDPVTGEARHLKYPGDYKCSHNNYQQVSQYLFASAFETRVCVERDQNDNPILFNPVVLAEVELPTGNKYVFTYTEYGEIDRVQLPTGGTESFTYARMPTLSYSAATYAQTNRGVVRREADPGGGAAASVWSYAVTSENPYTVRTTAPDLSYGERLLHRGLNTTSTSDFVKFGFDDVLAGMAYEERSFAPGGAMLRRSLSKWEAAGPTPGAFYGSRDPKVTKAVSILLDTGSANPLAKTTKNAYGQADEPLNVTAVTEYGFVEVARAAAEGGGIEDIPPGTALRSTETVYKDGEPYRSRNLVALPTEVTVRDGEPSANASPGPVVARTLTYYDEESYFGTDLSLLPCAPTQGRESSTPAAHGNVTTVSRWLDTLGGVGDASAYLDVHAQYDQCGNVRKSFKAAVHGTVSARVSETEYSADYHSAYPTRTLTPTPDATGQQGANVPLVTSSVYDFETGLVLSVRDESNYTSTNRTETVYSYQDPDNPTLRDPLNRLRLVTNPDGGWTRYDYGVAPGSLYVRTRTALDSERATDAYQYFDGLGRPTRSYAFDGASPSAWVASEKKYDTSGRVSDASNPVRVAAQGAALPAGAEWTTTSYDALGRVQSVTTPDGAVASTEYAGATVTVTDQALKKRSSVSDALGRLADVYEDPTGLNYHTSYQYDVLGNLRTVTQGAQTRSFAYDSLARLTSATNPEACRTETGQCIPVPTTYEYNADGSLKKRTDARGVQTSYEYDGLGRVKSRSYVTPAPLPGTATVTYKYDGADVTGGVPNAKGRLTEVGSSVSTYSYGAYDVMGRVKSSSQTTAGQTYAMSYEYDLAGNLKEETYPSGRKVATGFEAAGRVSSVTGVKAGEADRPYASQIAYTPHGAEAQLKLGNGLWEHTLYNSRLQPKEIGLGATASDAGVLKLEYAYAPPLDPASDPINGQLDLTKNNGDVRAQRISVPAAGQEPAQTFTQTYGYDKLNRLESAEEKNGAASNWKQVYAYDRYGNRTLSAGTTYPAQLDTINNPAASGATNRLASAGYSYDEAGNLKCDAPHPCAGGGTNTAYFDYDGESRMVRAGSGGSEYGSGGSAYDYDGDGRRVRKAVTGGEVTVFVYDAMGKLVTEYSNVVQNNGTRYLTQDNLGSTRAVTDKDGAIKSRHDYLPFGEELLAGTGGRTTTQGYSAAANVRQKFTGYERDGETGLDYAQARYYANVHGRFISVDPLTGSARPAQPQSWNRYAYCLDNPLAYVDPTGMIWGERDIEDGKVEIQWFADQKALDAAGKEWSATTRFLRRDPDGGWFAFNRFAGTFDHLSDRAVAATLLNGGAAYRMLGFSSPLYTPLERFGNAVDEVMNSEGMRKVIRDPGVQGALLAMGVFMMPTGAAVGAAAEGASSAGNLVRVGRWMSPAEFEAMSATGMVQESQLGVTNVASPANASAFLKQAQVGSLYAEFDVPAASVVNKGGGWGLIPGPQSIYARQALRQGLQVPEMPPAENIIHCATKICN